MDTLVKADIFFFISSIALILVTVAILIAVYYMVLATRRFDRFTRIIERKIESTQDEVAEIKGDIQKSFLYKLLTGKKEKPRR